MTVKVTPEEIEAVARTVVGPAYDKVQTALAAFRDTHDGAGAFGGSAPGEHLATLHSNVKTVFTETVQGVGEDLDTFKHNLTTTARGWHDTEQSNSERSQTLASRLGTTAATATHHAYRGTRDELGQRLAVDPSLQQPAEDVEVPDDGQQPAGGEAAPAPTAGGESADGSGAGGG